MSLVIAFFMDGFKQISEVLCLWRYFVTKAGYVLKNFYSQTVIGMLWEPFSLFFVAFCISFLWGRVLDESDFIEYFLYILCGYYIWGFLSGIVQDGITVFNKHNRSIINENKSLLFYVVEQLIQALSKSMLVFPFALVCASVLGDANMVLSFLKILVFFFFVFISGIGFLLIFGALCHFYKDIKLVIQSLMRLMFLMTPIIWKTDRLGDYEKYIWLNPFYVYVETGRSVLMYSEFGSLNLTVLCLQSVFLLVLGFVVLYKFENKLRMKSFIL